MLLANQLSQDLAQLCQQDMDATQYILQYRPRQYKIHCDLATDRKI